MKKILFGILLLSLAGCASVTIPRYIHDKHPYERTFFVSFEEAKQAVIGALDETGWLVEHESEPSLYERDKGIYGEREQILIFSRIRQMSFFLGTNYARVNAYIREVADKECELELRYMKVTTVVFKDFQGYKNDRAVESIFRAIEAQLNTSEAE